MPWVMAEAARLVLDNARYQRHALGDGRGGTPRDDLARVADVFPQRNLSKGLGKLVQADELCCEYWWCLPGRYYPTRGPFKQATSNCLADTSGRHQAQFNTLLTLKFPVFKSAAQIINCEKYSARNSLFLDREINVSPNHGAPEVPPAIGGNPRGTD